VLALSTQDVLQVGVPCYDRRARHQKELDVPDASLLFVETFRDWVIIFMGIAVAAFFVVAMVITIVLGLLLRSLLKKSNSVLDDNVRPLLDSARSTTNQVKGTATFVSEAAVTPIIRVNGVAAGVRRAAGVIAGLTGAGGDKPKA